MSPPCSGGTPARAGSGRPGGAADVVALHPAQEDGGAGAHAAAAADVERRGDAVCPDRTTDGDGGLSAAAAAVEIDDADGLRTGLVEKLLEGLLVAGQEPVRMEEGHGPPGLEFDVRASGAGACEGGSQEAGERQTGR